jgi:hypothetical protein
MQLQSAGPSILFGTHEVIMPRRGHRDTAVRPGLVVKPARVARTICRFTFDDSKVRDLYVLGDVYGLIGRSRSS